MLGAIFILGLIVCALGVFILLGPSTGYAGDMTGVVGWGALALGMVMRVGSYQAHVSDTPAIEVRHGIVDVSRLIDT